MHIFIRQGFASRWFPRQNVPSSRGGEGKLLWAPGGPKELLSLEFGQELKRKSRSRGMRSLDLPWSAQRTWQREPMPKISATRRPLLGMEGRIELPGAEDQCSQAM